MTQTDVLLDIKNLKKHFKTKNGMLHAVDGISFSIDKGRTLGLVGESGCGKSTVGRSIIRLLEPTSGSINFDGTDICSLNNSEMRKKRKDMQIIFQDPFSSLNPRKSLSQTIEEPMRRHNIFRNKKEREKRVYELMETVGLSKNLADSYPHELDGGRRQRIGIARALAMSPKFIVCDEPVSALDVSIQAQILNLLEQLQADFGLTYLFITHDLSVVYHFSDDIAVMYLGKFVEKTSAEKLFNSPKHPYTQALLSAILIPSIGDKKERMLLKGEISSPINPQPICRFANRCNHVMDRCRKEEPELREIEPGHFVSCFHYE